MIVRDARADDDSEMTSLLNQIIAIGGTTAHQTPMTAAIVRQYFIDGSGVETSVLAEVAGQVIGWQSLGLWQDEMHIGTFVRPGTQSSGVGTAMFAMTCQRARARGLTRIIAHIRADNASGLAYYARIGFRDVGQDPGFALNDGTVVGRVFRAFDLDPAPHV